MARKNRSGSETGLNQSDSAPSSSSSSESGPALAEDLLKRCTFPDADSVDCAVSGGADSSALLILAAASGRHVHAFHVDHGIRSGSTIEATLVQALAERLGADFSALRCSVADGPDLEARARRARHDALPPGVLFGHTMDDLAETVLQRLMRGTGPAGLGAMDESNHPILGLRRSETVALCDAFGVQVFEDPSNLDPRFVRNRVRRELIPLMNDISERDVVPLLARHSILSREQDDFVRATASDIDPSDALALAAAPAVLAATALRQWWSAQTGDPYPPDAAAIERIMAVARGHSKGCEVGSGWSVRRTNQRLRLVHEKLTGPEPRRQD